MSPRALELALVLALAELILAPGAAEEGEAAVGAAPPAPAAFHRAAKVRSEGWGDSHAPVCVPRTPARCSCPRRRRGGCPGTTW